jgi:hypothetical protein
MVRPLISPETRAQIRRYFYVEHWKIGTIASDLNVHPDAVRNAIESERFHSTPPLRASVVDPYIGFIRQTLDQHPRLRATRIFQMVGVAATAAVSCSCAAQCPACVRKSANPSCNCRCFQASRPKSIGRTSVM